MILEVSRVPLPLFRRFIRSNEHLWAFMANKSVSVSDAALNKISWEEFVKSAACEAATSQWAAAAAGTSAAAAAAAAAAAEGQQQQQYHE